MAEETTAAGTAAGTPTAEDRIKTLEGNVQRLAARNQQLEAAVVNPAYLEFLEGKGRAPAKAPAPAAEPGLSDEQVDALPPSQLARHIEKRVETATKNIIREVMQTEVAPRLDAQDVKDAAGEIAVCQERYKDFWSYREPMVKLAAQNPKLNTEDLYILACGRAGKTPQLRNPEATPTGDEGAHAKTGDEAGKKAGAPARGETPGTAGPRRAAVAHKEGKSSAFDQAFEASWKESGL